MAWSRLGAGAWRGLACVAAAGALLPVPAWAWPADDAWLALEQGGAPVVEAADDATPADIELAGSPVVSWAADGAYVYTRLVLASSARGDGTWAWAVDLDGDDRADGLVSVTGNPLTATLWQAGSAGAGLSGAEPWTGAVPLGDEPGDDVRVSSLNTGEVVLSVRTPRILLGILGLADDTPQRWLALAATGDQRTAWVDVAGCEDTTADCDNPTWSDALVLDADGDQLTLSEERYLFSDPGDADSDDDGVLDGADPGPVTCDSDHDGLPDGLELGVQIPGPSTDVDVGCFVADADPSTRSDPTDADSDDGGLPDGLEDVDHDGAIGPFETDPSDPSDDPDSDGDHIPDVIEGRGDDDGDGIPDYLDPDTDADGLIDLLDGISDIDGDGLPAFRDPDADNDGIADGLDGISDIDGDGLPAYLDTDSDGDGIGDAIEGISDYDGDGVPNHIDRDSDGDNRRDADEGTGDDDCDGRPDYLDEISDDGFCDTALPRPAVDTDPFESGREPIVPAEPGDFTGGACSHAPTSGMLVVLALAALRRRRTAVLAALLIAPIAQSVELNAQRLRPTTDGWRFVVLEDPGLPFAGSAGASLVVNHAVRPLVFRAGDRQRELLGGVTTTDVSGYLVPASFLRLGFAVPLHFALRGDAFQRPAALGDIRLGLKAAVFQGTARVPLAVAVSGLLELPTGVSRLFVGERQTTGELTVGLRADPASRLALLAEVGLRTGSGESLGTLRASPQLVFGGGASLLLADHVLLAAEVDGALWTGNGGAPGALPTEVLLTLRGRAKRHLVLSVGGGSGLSSGVTAPAWRVVAGLGWMPGQRNQPWSTAEPVTPGGS